MRTLFLAWQDKQRSRRWYPIGRLDIEPSLYRFRYIGGAKQAEKEAGFPPLYDFPDFEKDYRSPELFSLFKNRIIASGRPDRGDYLRNLDLTGNADPFEILSVNGGRRATDHYEVFPKIVKQEDGKFLCRFFLHGHRYVNSTAKERINSLKANDKVYLALELTNPATGIAVQIQTEDYQMIGWAPRYLEADLIAAMSKSRFDDLTAATAELSSYETRVVRINPQPAPWSQRALIEMQGRWNKHDPMTGCDFAPLVQ